MLLLLALLGYAVVVVFLNVLFMPHGLLEHEWGSSTGDVVLYDPGESECRTQLI